MNLYQLALFLHIVGVVCFFMPLGVYLFGLLALRRARQAQQVRMICQAIFATDAVAVGGILLVAVAGLYMAFTAWGIATGWVIVAVVSFALMAPIGPLLVERRLHVIATLTAEASNEPLSREAQQRIDDPVMGAGLLLMIAWLLGIIYLMTTKPTLQGAIVAMIVAAALGLLAGAPFWLTRRRAKAIAG